ncbi:ABC transporter permease [Amorphoplanes digitatis]|uniref:Transport permease protein n=1 Tax=Actinoplanes digitatis TaxID=1868 RepID=A0A7W7I3R3_9ACTN|nr:ABC transporter permease [Actinoplanes digitatis]MBB4765842.1 lipooligosaccharide transport system permease protein [Actinoplanes digitatis]BFE75770.1 ABC transporter permease [Actinoplanes digitatis]GID93366.1 transport permease protein [Actinoplanes digitatis]
MTRYVLEYHLVSYRRIWRASVLSSFVLPLLTMLGFGVGVGAYVTGGVDGVPYLDWIVPGLIASTAMQVAMSDSTWPVLGGFEWQRLYFGQAAAPLRVADILDGHLAFIVFRTLTSCGAFLLIATAFGTAHSWWALATLPIAALVGLSVATGTFAYSATVRSDSYLAILFRLGMIPMSLFSGVFFPVESLPALLRGIAYVLPLWHGVDLSRAAMLGVAPTWSMTGHLLYLALWAGLGWLLALRQFRRRLVV